MKKTFYGFIGFWLRYIESEYAINLPVRDNTTGKKGGDMKIRRWLPALLVSGLILLSTSASAQTLRIIPVPPGVKPQWQKVAGAPNVSFAPNIPTDVFRYRGRYYLNWDGAWFGSRTLKGPWELSSRPPRALDSIPPSYFKTASRGPAMPGPGRGPQGGPSAGPPSPGAFQPPGAPSGTGKRDPFAVPGVAPPPGWTPPEESGAPGAAPPAVPPPGWPPAQPGPEAVMPPPEGAPEAGKQVPKAM